LPYSTSFPTVQPGGWYCQLIPGKILLRRLLGYQAIIACS
jgi:hypothetical protein